MGRSKKYSSSVKTGATIKTGILVVLIVGSCVGYLWLKKEINTLAATIRMRDSRLRQVREANEKMTPQLATLMDPFSLEKKVKQMQLGLAQPDLSHVWRLPEPAAAAPATAPGATVGMPKGMDLAAQKAVPIQ